MCYSKHRLTASVTTRTYVSSLKIKHVSSVQLLRSVYAFDYIIYCLYSVQYHHLVANPRGIGVEYS